jgi:hypothetical protein
MFESFDKLLKSNGTLILLGLVLVPYLLYALFHSAPVKKIIPHSKPTKTLEEIIQGTPTDVKEESWDKDFKSAIEPIAENKGLR